MAKQNTSTNNAPATTGKKYLRAFVVEKRDENNEFWHRVGAAFPHQDGKGFDLLVPPGISLSGRIVIREAKPAEARGDED